MRLDPTIGSPSAPVIPDDFLNVLEPFQLGLDRRLGYTQGAPYASFWMDDGRTIAWSDGRCHSRAMRAWSPFVREVVPLATFYGLKVTNDSPSQQYVLTLDRRQGWAYFAPRASALAFLDATAAADVERGAESPQPSQHEPWRGYRANTLIGAARFMRGDGQAND